MHISKLVNVQASNLDTYRNRLRENGLRSRALTGSISAEKTMECQGAQITERKNWEADEFTNIGFSGKVDDAKSSWSHRPDVHLHHPLQNPATPRFLKSSSSQTLLSRRDSSALEIVACNYVQSERNPDCEQNSTTTSFIQQLLLLLWEMESLPSLVPLHKDMQKWISGIIVLPPVLPCINWSEWLHNYFLLCVWEWVSEREWEWAWEWAWAHVMWVAKCLPSSHESMQAPNSVRVREREGGLIP